MEKARMLLIAARWYWVGMDRLTLKFLNCLRKKSRWWAFLIAAQAKKNTSRRKGGAAARYHTPHTKTMLPTRKSAPKSSKQSDHTKTSWSSQTSVVWSCLPSIRPGQNYLARHSERGKKTRQTGEEVWRQHQGMDGRGVRQVLEGSGERGKMEETVCEIICGSQRPLRLRDRWDDDEMRRWHSHPISGRKKWLCQFEIEIESFDSFNFLANDGEWYKRSLLLPKTKDHFFCFRHV